jgi:mersacidin/lichenicidin family type 2 lantibiotic
MKKQTLTVQEIIRAWKDKNFRDSLSEEQRAQLPANPAGLVEIDDEQLVQVAGGAIKRTVSGDGNGCSRTCP